MSSIRAVLERYAGWRATAVALAVAVACATSLVWRRGRLGGLDLLDSRVWYTPGEAAELFDALDRLDANARLLYAATGLTIDMAYPAAYGVLFAILLYRLWRVGPALYLLPLAMAAADVLENVAIAGLVLGHAGAPSPLAWLAAAFTLVKWVFGLGTLAAAGIGAVRWLQARLRRRIGSRPLPHISASRIRWP